jgi:uncharacterized Rossmann fold enzyme
MDFDNTPRKFSSDKAVEMDMDLKRRKLKFAKRLLEMLAKQSRSKLVNKSATTIKGIKSL